MEVSGSNGNECGSGGSQRKRFWKRRKRAEVMRPNKCGSDGSERKRAEAAEASVEAAEATETSVEATEDSEAIEATTASQKATGASESDRNNCESYRSERNRVWNRRKRAEVSESVWESEVEESVETAE